MLILMNGSLEFLEFLSIFCIIVSNLDWKLAFVMEVRHIVRVYRF